MFNRPPRGYPGPRGPPGAPFRYPGPGPFNMPRGPRLNVRPNRPFFGPAGDFPPQFGMRPGAPRPLYRAIGEATRPPQQHHGVGVVLRTSLPKQQPSQQQSKQANGKSAASSQQQAGEALSAMKRSAPVEVPEAVLADETTGAMEDDVVSLFGGSDIGEGDNATTNVAGHGNAAGSKGEDELPPSVESGPSASAASTSEKPPNQAVVPVLAAAPKKPSEPVKKVLRPTPPASSASVSGKADRQPDLRNQLNQTRKGTVGGGGLLPRPPASELPPRQPASALPPRQPASAIPPRPFPPPQQQLPMQRSFRQQQQQQPPPPAAKRSRTLLDSEPGPSPSLRGRFQLNRGGLSARGRNYRAGPDPSVSGDGDVSYGSRVLLPTPLDADMAEDATQPPQMASMAENFSGSLLLLPTSTASTKAATSGLLRTPEQRQLVARPSGPLLAEAPTSVAAALPTPSESAGSGRVPLLAPPTRSHVLPLPHQVESQGVGPSQPSSSSAASSIAMLQQPRAAANYGGSVAPTAIAAYPTEPVSTATTVSGASIITSSSGAAASASGVGLLGRLPPRGPVVKTEAQMRADLTEAFKGLQFELGYELLKEARAAYPHEFTDPVVYEVVEFCATKEAFDVCVLTARLISEPNVKLLELLADIAEKNPGQLRHLTDDLWLVFNYVLTLQPEAKAIMAFIRCFSSLKSWTKVWSAVERFAPMQIIPIEGFIFCMEALVNGNASEFVNQGISLLSNMDLQNLQQVGLELIERLWLRCALDGSADNVVRIEQIRALFHVAPAQHSNFLNRIRVKVTELVMGNEFETLCKFFSSVTNLEVLSEFVIDAFHVAEDPQSKFEMLATAVAEKFRNRNPAMEAFISQTAVRLLKKSVERMHWAESLRLLRSIQGQNIGLIKAVSSTQPDMSEAAIANLAFQIYLRNQCHSIAASMLSADTSPIGIALPVAGDHAATRFQLLHELCTACITEGALADAGAALNAMMRHPAPRTSELNKLYNEFLAACCEKATTAEDLKSGVEIIPLAHQCSLVISATVLRMLLCASSKHGLKAYAKEYLELGTRVGIYPVVSVSCPGPKTVQLQSDLAKEEIQVVLTNLFVKLKKYLMDSLQTRELDVIQECTIKLTALNVGSRDAKFVELHRIQSSEQAVLQRASEILQTPSHFQSVVSTRFLSENGVNVLKLDGTMVYQCVYYVDEE